MPSRPSSGPARPAATSAAGRGGSDRATLRRCRPSRNSAERVDVEESSRRRASSTARARAGCRAKAWSIVALASQSAGVQRPRRARTAGEHENGRPGEAQPVQRVEPEHAAAPEACAAPPRGRAPRPAALEARRDDEAAAEEEDHDAELARAGRVGCVSRSTARDGSSPRCCSSTRATAIPRRRVEEVQPPDGDRRATVTGECSAPSPCRLGAHRRGPRRTGRAAPYDLSLTMIHHGPVARRPAHRPARRGDGRRRPAGPDDAPGRHRARPVAAGARRRPGRLRGARRRRRPARRPPRPRRAARRSPTAPPSSPSTTSTCRPSTCARSRPTGIRVAPGPDALVHAQDKLVLRRALADGRGAAAGRGPRRRDVARRRPRSPTTHGWPVVLKTPRGGYDGKGVFVVDGPTRSADLPRRSTARCWSRSGSPMRARARRAGRALAVRPGRRLAGGRDRAARRHLRRGARPRPGPGRRRSAAAAQELAVRIADRLGVVGMLAVELFETAGRRAGQRAGHAAAQLRPLDDRGLAHQPVRAAPARRPRLPAGLHGDDRAGRRHGQRARRRGGAPTTGTGPGWTSGCTTSWRTGPT